MCAHTEIIKINMYLLASATIVVMFPFGAGWQCHVWAPGGGEQCGVQFGWSTCGHIEIGMG